MEVPKRVPALPCPTSFLNIARSLPGILRVNWEVPDNRCVSTDFWHQKALDGITCTKKTPSTFSRCSRIHYCCSCNNPRLWQISDSSCLPRHSCSPSLLFFQLKKQPAGSATPSLPTWELGTYIQLPLLNPLSRETADTDTLQAQSPSPTALPAMTPACQPWPITHNALIADVTKDSLSPDEYLACHGSFFVCLF